MKNNFILVVLVTGSLMGLLGQEARGEWEAGEQCAFLDNFNLVPREYDPIKIAGFLDGAAEVYTRYHGQYNISTERILTGKLAAKINRQGNYQSLIYNLYSYILSGQDKFTMYKLLATAYLVDSNENDPVTKERKAQYSLIKHLSNSDFITLFLIMGFSYEELETKLDFSQKIITAILNEQKLKLALRHDKVSMEGGTVYPDLKQRLLVALSNSDFEEIDRILSHPRVTEIANRYGYFCFVQEKSSNVELENKSSTGAQDK